MKPIAASELKGTDYTIIIPNMVYQQIMYWINMTDKEVSGFGSVIADHNIKTYTIGDVFLPKQENMSSSSEIDDEDLARWMFKRKDIENGLKWHWHSHVNMNVFWSADDMNIIRGLGHQDWILASVFNKKREVRSAYMTTVEVNGHRHEIFEDELNTHILNPLDPQLVEAWEKEFKDNVNEKKWSGSLPMASMGNQMTLPGGPNTTTSTDMTGFPSNFEYSLEDAKPGEVESDEWGCCYIGGEAIYNPLTDKYTETADDTYQALIDMDEKELRETFKWFPETVQFMNHYTTGEWREAQLLNKTNGYYPY